MLKSYANQQKLIFVYDYSPLVILTFNSHCFKKSPINIFVNKVNAGTHNLIKSNQSLTLIC